MSLTSGPINESEQAGEKFADHIGEKSEPMVIRIIDHLFSKLWRTRVVIDIDTRDMPGDLK